MRVFLLFFMLAAWCSDVVFKWNSSEYPDGAFFENSLSGGRKYQFFCDDDVECLKIESKEISVVCEFYRQASLFDFGRVLRIIAKRGDEEQVGYVTSTPINRCEGCLTITDPGGNVFTETISFENTKDPENIYLYEVDEIDVWVTRFLRDCGDKSYCVLVEFGWPLLHQPNVRFAARLHSGLLSEIHTYRFVFFAKKESALS